MEGVVSWEGYYRCVPVTVGGLKETVVSERRQETAENGEARDDAPRRPHPQPILADILGGQHGRILVTRNTRGRRGEPGRYAALPEDGLYRLQSVERIYGGRER